MSTLLKKAIDSIKQLSPQKMVAKKNIPEYLLGKYRDVIPQELSSTEFIKKLRTTMYDKVKE